MSRLEDADDGSPSFSLRPGTARWANKFSKIELSIIFAVVLGALGAALYQAWTGPIQAVVAVVILIVAAVGLTGLHSELGTKLPVAAEIQIIACGLVEALKRSGA